jgi:hypothetical protein
MDKPVHHFYSIGSMGWLRFAPWINHAHLYAQAVRCGFDHWDLQRSNPHVSWGFISRQTRLFLGRHECIVVERHRYNLHRNMLLQKISSSLSLGRRTSVRCVGAWVGMDHHMSLLVKKIQSSRPSLYEDWLSRTNLLFLFFFFFKQFSIAGQPTGLSYSIWLRWLEIAQSEKVNIRSLQSFRTWIGMKKRNDYFKL